jgi:hypothetical protein
LKPTVLGRLGLAFFSILASFTGAGVGLGRTGAGAISPWLGWLEATELCLSWCLEHPSRASANTIANVADATIVAGMLMLKIRRKPLTI